LGSDDARIRLQAAEALLAAARGPKGLRTIPPALKQHVWTIEDVMLGEPLAAGYDTE